MLIKNDCLFSLVGPFDPLTNYLSINVLHDVWVPNDSLETLCALAVIELQVLTENTKK